MGKPVVNGWASFLPSVGIISGNCIRTFVLMSWSSYAIELLFQKH